MIRRRLVFAVAALLSVLLVGPVGESLAQQAPSTGQRVTRTGHVYLFRGFANVFSVGLNTLTNEFRANGMKADVYNHTAYQSVAARAAKEYRESKGREPIFIVGHSLGADAAIAMAALLGQQGIPVALLATVDAFSPPVVPANVKYLINYHQYASPTNPGAGLKTGDGFTGKVDNVNVRKTYGSEATAIDHFNIASFDKIHENVMKAVFARSRKK